MKGSARRSGIVSSSPLYACTVQASGCASDDPDGQLAMWEWNYGDGRIDRIVSSCLANHTYRAAGTYTVTLFVYDDGDGTGPPMSPTQPDFCTSRRHSAPDTMLVTCAPGP